MGGQGEMVMAAPNNNNVRLDRIEEKIDKLSEAMISIARAEEKLVNMEQKYAAQYERLNRFSEKLDAMEKAVIANSQTVNNIVKLFWIVVVAAVGAIISQIYM